MPRGGGEHVRALVDYCTQTRIHRDAVQFCCRQQPTGGAPMEEIRLRGRRRSPRRVPAPRARRSAGPDHAPDPLACSVSGVLRSARPARHVRRVPLGLRAAPLDWGRRERNSGPAPRDGALASMRAAARDFRRPRRSLYPRAAARQRRPRQW